MTDLASGTDATDIDDIDRLDHAVARIATAATERAEQDDATRRGWRVANGDELESNQSAEEAIERARNEGLEQAELEHETAVEAARRKASATQAELEDDAESQRKDVEEKFAKRDKRLKTAFDEALWVADTVFEANEDKPKLRFEQESEQVRTRLNEISEIRELGAIEVRRYRQRAGKTSAAQATSDIDTTHLIAETTLEASTALARLRALRFARIFRGGVPIVFVVFGTLVGIGVAALQTGTLPENQQVLFGAAIGLGATVLLLFPAWVVARSHVRAPWLQLANAHARAAAAIDGIINEAAKARRRQEAALVKTRDEELASANATYPPKIEATAAEHTARLDAIGAKIPGAIAALETERDDSIARAETIHTERRALAETTYADAVASETERHAAVLAKLELDTTNSDASIETNWLDAMTQSESIFSELIARSDDLHPSFTDSAWRSFAPRTTFPTLVRFGELQLDLADIAQAQPAEERFATPMPAQQSLPAFLGFPHPCSLLIETDRAGRESGIDLVRALMLRMLASMPAGKIRFTVIDPVGLGEPFAGFMHLADHDEKLIQSRIWTETRHIEQRLLDLTEHMETVIQKYLRNEFESIMDYNEAAGEIAEPLRVLVVCDFPANFNDISAKRLASIATSGPRCGVHTIVLRDRQKEIPESLNVATLHENAVVIQHEEGEWHLQQGALTALAMRLDPAPPEELITQVAHAVGAAAVEAGRVEVPFDVIAPNSDQYWTASSENKLSVSLGRTGATKLQELVLGVGTAQHALIAGKTGSGKSTLLHALITNLACWYSPDEVEFWLVDFKKGVEFKTYATHSLPHARAVAVESDREFGLSVLKGLDEELKHRGELFRDLGVQDLAGFRRTQPDQVMPRVLLIIDEFQELFVEDDKISQDASLLLDRLVRQGRAFGMHVVLGSQTLAGAYSLARSTMGQMGVRIALQCSESDSQIILSDDNSAARLLSRPGEAIYNDQSGLLEGNSPFQVVWLDEAVRERRLADVEALGKKHGHKFETIVFEGNRPADIEQAKGLNAAIDALPTAMPSAARTWLGEAVAIKDPTSGTFRRQAAANLLILGQRDESALALSAATLLALAAQYRSDDAQFTVIDGTPSDEIGAGLLGRLASALPHQTTVPGFREVDEAVLAVGTELARRVENGTTDAPAIFLIIHGLSRFRSFRRNENDFGYSLDSEESDAPPAADKVLATILREGSLHGVHMITWCDTVASLQRTFDRQAIAEFDQRALYQIGATDSSTLIDSPVASRLGFNRALLFSEEHGTIEKFRPWQLPDEDWLISAAERLVARENG